jgi:hypothetical protein
MPRRPAFTPSTDDVRQLSEHLTYEVIMTFSLARLLAKPQVTVFDRAILNAELEAFTIHMRQLIDFLWGDRSERPDSEDAFALDYFPPGAWARLRPKQPAILTRALRQKVGWGVAHLTYRRRWVTVLEKQWQPIALAQALAPAVICFAENVDPSKLDPAQLRLLKPYAESVQPRRLPSTSTTAST